MFWYGCLAFLFFVLYDFNDLTRNNERLEVLYPAGAILFGLALGSQALEGTGTLPLAVRILTGLLALAFFALLFWTIFLIAKRGVEKRAEGTPWGEKTAITRGVYALCRHPGVWWLTLGCLCLVPSVGIPLNTALTYSVLGLLLAFFEDRWIFPKTYRGYARYQQETPFLFPNRGSAARCRATWKKEPVKTAPVQTKKKK